jgi:hypothetical protein
MSGGSTVAKREWVERVLGIGLPQPGRAGTPEAWWAAARSGWQAASDAADAQIAELQKALRASGDDVLEEIAEYGVNGVTGGFKVPLMAAMREVDAAGATPAAFAKLAKVVEGFSAHIAKDDRVMACDENPFGVAVSLRATLGGALATMQQAIGAAGA